jgi:hypothetical protein
LNVSSTTPHELRDGDGGERVACELMGVVVVFLLEPV